MIERGVLQFVEDRPEGSSLSAAVTIGALLLPVVNGQDFSQDGGLLSLGDNSYLYTGKTSTGELVLDAANPVEANADAGDPVLSLNDLGQAESVWIAHVLMDEDDEELVEATVSTADRKHLSLGDGDVGALVDVEDRGNGYQFVSRPYDPAEFDGLKMYAPMRMAAVGSNVSIPHNTWTTVTAWFTMKSDRVGLDLNGRFEIRESGLYDCRFGATFANNTSGNRAIRVVSFDVAGNMTVHRQVKIPSDGQVALETAQLLQLWGGLSSVAFQVWQSSGAALDLVGSNVLAGEATRTDCAVVWLRP